jgi:hypothetical protein
MESSSLFRVGPWRCSQCLAGSGVSEGRAGGRGRSYLSMLRKVSNTSASWIACDPPVMVSTMPAMVLSSVVVSRRREGRLTVERRVHLGRFHVCDVELVGELVVCVREAREFFLQRELHRGSCRGSRVEAWFVVNDEQVATTWTSPLSFLHASSPALPVPARWQKHRAKHQVSIMQLLTAQTVAHPVVVLP